jgi:hypothetical protein
MDKTVTSNQNIWIPRSLSLTSCLLDWVKRCVLHVCHMWGFEQELREITNQHHFPLHLGVLIGKTKESYQLWRHTGFWILGVALPGSDLPPKAKIQDRENLLLLSWTEGCHFQAGKRHRSCMQGPQRAFLARPHNGGPVKTGPCFPTCL